MIMMHNLDLVVRRLRVVRRTLLHLHCQKTLDIHILYQPHGGEVAPAELGDHLEAVVVDLPQLNGVVAVLLVAVLA